LKTSLIAFAGFVGVMAVACGGGAVVPPTHVDTAVSPTASFDRYRTFSIGLTERSPLDEPVTARALDAQTRLRALIVDALEAKGYAAAAGGQRADLVVKYASATHEVPASKNDWHPENPELVLEGSIVVDVFDSASGVELWQGRIAAPVDRHRIDDVILRRGVDRVLASFPSQGDRRRAPLASTAAPARVD
jgi:hypothetical protein